LHVPPALFDWLVLLVAVAKMPLEDAELVTGTQLNSSNPLLFRYLWCVPTPYNGKTIIELYVLTPVRILCILDFNACDIASVFLLFPLVEKEQYAVTW